jgi:hypothetical protein
MARDSFQNRRQLYPKANAPAPHQKALYKFPPLAPPPEEKTENTMSAMQTAKKAKMMLQIIITPMRNRLLTNATGVARSIAIWEVMPAPDPGAGNPVVLMNNLLLDSFLPPGGDG